MNKIINFSLKNKFAVWLITLIITAAGLYSGLNMKMETIPNISTPIVSISTAYPGAPPEEVSEEVTKPVAQRVQNLSGVETVSSTSSKNFSSIQIQYGFDKDMDQAEEEVNKVLSKLELPEGAQEPSASRLSFNAFPILSLSVTSEEKSLEKLTELVENNVVPSLEGLEGVSSVEISGQQVEEVQLTFDQEKMQKYALDQEKVKNIIKGSDVTYPLGLFQFSGEQKTVVVDGNVTTLADLKKLEIPVTPAQTAPSNPGAASAPQGQTAGPSSKQMNQAKGLPTVQLSEIAEIESEGKVESISRTNGDESIGIQVVKSADANTVEAVNQVMDKLKDLKSEYEGLQAVPIFDQGEPIEDSVNTMLSKALFGALFAVIIILLFLRNIRTTLISVISIPLSLLIALLLLNQMDITLNIMTLGAMTVAIGRVIDDSIVVIENIFRRMSLTGEKLKGRALIREATKEMFVPIMSSTVVTIAVFLPLGLVEGTVGELFLPFALTVVFALLASLLVAVTIVPMLAHSLFKSGNGKKNQQEDKPGKLAGVYKRVLNWTLNHKIVTFGLAILLLAGSFFLVPAIGVSFLPSDQQKMVVATYNPEPGQTEGEIEEIALEAEDYFLEREGVTTLQYSIGGGNPMNPGGSTSALFYVKYDEDYEGISNEKKQVIEDLKGMTGKGEWGTQSMGSTGSSNTLELLVYGENREDVEAVVGDLAQKMKGNDSLTNVDSSLSESYDQYTLMANQETLSQYGLTAAQLGMQLSGIGEQSVLTTIQKDGEEVNVYINVEEKQYENIDDLKDTAIQAPTGMEIPVEDVVEVEEGKSPDTITHRNGKLYASVSGEITGSDVAQVSSEFQSEVEESNLPDGVEVEFGGVSQQINESFTQLGLAMLAAVAVVYLVLVITFGGALAPFAILFSLPFSIIGGLGALYLSGETISVSAMIGALMLIGIVVTNAIVLIDRVIHKEKDGLSTRDSLLEAGATRLRPILMTALATIGALAPLAVGLEGGGLISKGLGVTVIGGLTSSTLLTLVIVPIVYEFLAKFRKKNLAEDEE